MSGDPTKNWSPCTRPFNVTHGYSDTDFLLVIHSNYEPISYRFHDIWIFRPPKYNFFPTLCLMTRLRILLSKFCNAAWAWCPYHAVTILAPLDPGGNRNNRGGTLPFPLPSSSFTLIPPLISRPFPSLPSPFPLEVGPLNPVRGSGERRKLAQRGLGRSPSRNRIWCILALKSDIWWQQF